MKTITVSLRNQQISPKKARLLMNLIRGKKVVEAEARLKFLDKAGGRLVSRLLKNGIDILEKKDFRKDEFYVGEAICGEGRALKRYRVKAKGRSVGYKRRKSHLKMSLSKSISQEVSGKSKSKIKKRKSKVKNGSKS